MIIRLVLILALILCDWTIAFAEENPRLVVENPVGQATGSTCQSYVLALGLAFKKDAAFPISSWRQLRTAETKIRNAIVEEFKKRVPGTIEIKANHEDVKSGFTKYTRGVYRLSIKDVDLQGLSDIVGSRTGVTKGEVVPQNFLVGAVVKDVVMSSAVRIDGDSYSDGHIFTILGMDGPMNSTRKFLILNSGVKIRDKTRNACLNELPDDPGPYTASINWRSLTSIELTSFGGMYKVWLVEKS